MQRQPDGADRRERRLGLGLEINQLVAAALAAGTAAGAAHTQCESIKGGRGGLDTDRERAQQLELRAAGVDRAALGGAPTLRVWFGWVGRG